VTDSQTAWSHFDVGSIPTKTDLTELNHFLDGVCRAGQRQRALEIGCGAGAVAAVLCQRGLALVGVDINAAGVQAARARVPDAVFHVRDITAHEGLQLAEAPFDIAVCQLVISIVGTCEDRVRMLRNVRAVLEPGGWLFVSASGRSEDINPGYAALYEQDQQATGEYGSYYSRDAAGRVLYPTHHFTEDELVDLLDREGFSTVSILRRREHSSRRPDEAAWFYYATCRVT
jgi:SAM-dependent methyltransferase